MKTVIPEEEIFRLIDASHDCSIGIYAADIVMRRFRSMHLLSSALICDAMVMNVLLNNEITPHSADEIITCMRRRRKSLYTTVESAFFPIEDGFNEYAKIMLGERYDEVRAMRIPTANYIVYVLSLELKECNADSGEIYRRAYTLEELATIKLPHY